MSDKFGTFGYIIYLILFAVLTSISKVSIDTQYIILAILTAGYLARSK